MRNNNTKMKFLYWNWVYCSFSGSSYRAMISMINRISSTNTPVPGLLQDDSNVPYCNADKLPPHSDRDIETGDPVYYCPHMIELELGELYEITLLDDKCMCKQQYSSVGPLIWFSYVIVFATIPVARVGISHAIHLHGHAFQVMDMGTRAEFENGNSTFANATHLPVIKDTVTMGWRHFVTIRFRATNPGYWLFHCHLEYHHKECIL